jgi:hypothetical protein
MTTKVGNSKLQPAVTMDMLHCDSLTFKQVRENNPKRSLSVSGVLYGLDGNGDKVYDKETFQMSDEDIDTTIVENWIASGGTLESFMTACAAAKTDINTRIAAGDITDAELMAYFEIVIGRLLELHGKITISNVE